MNVPRIMITGQSSGCGKTLITCGILQALKNRGMSISSFKCGPDYIDPMFHERVIGTKSRNLDSFFLNDDVLRYVFLKTAEETEISVIEGVMGFYDGKGAITTQDSSCDVSLKLDVPVILVVNCKGASLSCVPIIKGFLEFRENNIKGVILNNMSENTFSKLKELIESELGVKVIGFLPKVSELVLESRHLGLVMPSEVGSLREKLNLLADKIESTMDLDALIELASSASDIVAYKPKISHLDEKVKIGFAMDDVFCFTYSDNIQLLEEIGAEIVPFSPLNDKVVPEGISGMILSGGYPELHAKELSSNESMLKDINDKLNNGMPCIAECGGFMYLHSELEGADGISYGMVGYINGKTFNSHKLSRFGYVSLTSSKEGSVLEGTEIKGHEFHYWDSENNGSDWNAEKTNGKKYPCVHEVEGQVLGFPHLYYYSEPMVPYRFLMKCVEYGNKE